MPAPRALLLDLDDTILDDSSGVDAAWRTVCSGAVQRLHDVDADIYWSDPDRHREGRLDLRAARRRVIGDAFRSLGLDAPDEAARLAAEYSALREAAYAPIAGAIGTVEELHGMGLRLALLTNGGALSQRAKIDRFQLARFFDCILIEGEFGCGKPEPRIYHTALERLGVRPEAAWMVGDNFEWEVVAPRRLGLGTVWVDAAHTGPPADAAVRPDHIVRSICELPDLLRHVS